MTLSIGAEGLTRGLRGLELEAAKWWRSTTLGY